MRPRLAPVAGAAARAVAADRGGLVTTGGFYLLVTAVLASLWTAAARTSGGSIAGYPAAALVWYVATSEVVTIALPPRLVERFGDDIASGRFEVDLLRPAVPIWIRLAGETGTLLPRLGLCTALGLGYATMMAGSPPRLASLALAAPSLLLAALVNVVTQLLFATTAFWLREARSAGFLYQKLTFVLGGMLLPLEVLPYPMEAVARWLPFAAMAYVPARLASGRVEPWLLATQVLWLVLLVAAAGLAAAAGERRFLKAAS